MFFSATSGATSSATSGATFSATSSTTFSATFSATSSATLGATSGATSSASSSASRHNPSTRPGFSLVEIMVVIVIIGLLAGAVTVSVRAYLVKAKQNTAKHEIASFADALGMFYGEFDRFPTNDEGLEILMRPNEKFSDALLTRGDLNDPWGKPYVYNCPGIQPGEAFEVISLGADGRPGGESADQDIASYDLKGAKAKGP